MTRNKDFKALVRTRMSDTGENYTTARSRLLDIGHSDSIGQNSGDRHGAGTNDSAEIRHDTPHVDPSVLAFRRRTLSTFFRNGRLTAIPTKRKALVVILLEIRPRFEPGRIYTEKEINDLLAPLHPDFARLRRELIDYGYLEREPRTGAYWVPEELPTRRGNMLQEAGVLESLLR